MYACRTQSSYFLFERALTWKSRNYMITSITIFNTEWNFCTRHKAAHLPHKYLNVAVGSRELAVCAAHDYGAPDALAAKLTRADCLMPPVGCLLTSQSASQRYNRHACCMPQPVTAPATLLLLLLFFFVNFLFRKLTIVVVAACARSVYLACCTSSRPYCWVHFHLHMYIHS